MIELGLYKASFAREMAEKYEAEVIGCEAHPALAKALLAAPVPGLRAYELAIASETGTSVLYCNESGGHNSTVDPVLRDDGADETVVRTTTFSDFVESEVMPVWGDEPIDLVKVDIEGAELPMLLETPEAILRRLEQISVEFHDFRRAELKPFVDRARQRLRALGFDELRVTLDNQDVLFINGRFFGLSRGTRLVLILRYRIIGGIMRRVHRRLWRRERPDYLPPPREP